jgi:hypothetical protein
VYPADAELPTEAILRHPIPPDVSKCSRRFESSKAMRISFDAPPAAEPGLAIIQFFHQNGEIVLAIGMGYRV